MAANRPDPCCDARPAGEAPAAGSAILASAVSGAVVGAAGLAWWLLKRAERHRAEQRLLRLPRQPEIAPHDSDRPRLDHELHNRVQKLNQAIEEVRRQLEQLQPSP